MKQQRPDAHSLSASEWDVIVIGGGITGAGVAREAARRGLKTLLLEQRDYAWGTSSRSSKMVHGGLRYIASGDIRLTWHSLVERERLMRESSGLVTRMGYWFAHFRKKFPGPFVFGLLLTVYDVLARYRDHSYSARDSFLARMPGYLDKGLLGASRYTDALVDDARLVLRVLEEARADGAITLNYMTVHDLLMQKGRVAGVKALDQVSGEQVVLNAKAVISATGAWADRLRQPLAGETRIRPLRGSHLVIPSSRLPVAESVIFMHPDDGRAVFIYPWEGRTLVGTTDLDHRDDLDVEASISPQEFVYLLRAANSQFPGAKLVAEDVMATFSGVRPIVSSGKGRDPSQEKRDHSVFVDQGLVTVTGGKLTTFRQIALDALRAASSPLGINIRDDGAPIFRPVQLRASWPERLTARFGVRAAEVAAMSEGSDQALIPGMTVSWSELRWSLRHEQVVHLDDLLLRRVRMGLLLPHGGEEHLQRIAGLCQQELGWDEERTLQETRRYMKIWHSFYGTAAGVA
ncbi:MAG: glycerol-3-phosphate dehydrogenase/oxidase [Pseudomonadales bacterium]|nr:glycerol-3-phosphate dehydrogenase/oxidase [Pseudomonadales bacterium]